MSRTVEENRRLVRRYIRTLSKPCTPKKRTNVQGTEIRAEQMIRFFIVLHNFLHIEDLYYDQFLMKNMSINTNVKLSKEVINYFSALHYYGRMSVRGSKVRAGIERAEEIEEVRTLLREEENKDIYTKLIIN